MRRLTKISPGGERAMLHGDLRGQKRAVVLLLSVVMLATLVACGGNGGESGTDPNGSDSEAKTGSTTDYPAMVMVDDKLYVDAGETVTLSDGEEPDGLIEASCEAEPTENNQSNFGTGYNYRHGEGETVYVQYEDGSWHVFRPNGTKERDNDSLTEEEKMEMDPSYNAG